ncbi:hypothetical protein EYC98_13370 [Halieaceae bacterium IMCC14734]|uniref:Uncharacterized protein n=1 Tax=Candidatus Litorirhabdus singularis TaxID=2518993 RepID=A0ABT3THQ2_9GAMM|nr:SoxR reducing system RseC family protein [Candidatus Litorirhabdus singularis]MCX2981847.1 hypothetical protein [Candidatus Litorirhabdus singularis]
MLTETGRIVALEDDGLWVETIRATTCGNCAVRKGCGHGLLNEMGSGRSNYVRVPVAEALEPPLQLNEEVRFELPEQVVVKGSFVVYLLPLLCLLGGASLGDFLFPVAAGDLAAGLGAATGFGSGLLLVRLHAWKHRNNRDHQPRLLGRAGPVRL